MKKLFLIGSVLLSMISCRDLEESNNEITTTVKDNAFQSLNKVEDTNSSNTYEIEENPNLTDEDPKSPPRK